MSRKTATLVLTVCAALLCLAFTTTAPAARGNPEAGREKSTVCHACHGENGKAVLPIYPNLGGQYEDYLVHSLKQYRSGERVNALMSTFAANLSDQDIADLAAWYASQDGLKNLPAE